MRPTGAQRLAILGLIAIALGVAATALPRMIAGGLFAWAPSVRENATFPRANEASETLAWLARSQAWQPSAAAKIYAALSFHAKDKASAEERDTLIDLLAHSPLRPQQWLDLGQIFSAEGNRERALSAWRMSIFTGRILPSIMVDRLDLGLSLKNLMQTEDLRLLDEQVRLSFILRPAHVKRLLTLPQNAIYTAYCREIITALSETDIDHMVRIHALH
ncbi:MAG: hypothetical protein JXQ84_05170 [Rhodospirillaceae bacterium]|nr:hypothetical protein [Rhodospirillaceae bacterium]